MATGQKLNSGGWRYYGMNLAAFVCPVWGTPRVFRCQIPPDNFGNFDQDNYLGFGAFLLLVFFFFHVKDLFRRENLRKNWLLALILTGMTLFALSPQVRYMTTVLVEYEPGEIISWLGDTFRFSGRFFWSVWYLLVFFLLKTAGQVFGKKAWLILPIFLGIQIWDIYPLYMDKVNFFNSNNKPEGVVFLRSPEWAELARKYKNVFVFDYEGYEMAWYWAIKYRKNVNYGFLNRPTPKAKETVDAVRQQLMSGYIAPEYRDYFFLITPKLLQQINTMANIDPRVKELASHVRQIDGVNILEYSPELMSQSEEFMSRPIPVAHKYWSDQLIQTGSHRLYRLLPNNEKDYASILVMDGNRLILQWDSWGEERFQMQGDGWYHMVDK